MEIVALVILSVMLIVVCVLAFVRQRPSKAVRLAVTLKDNHGAFVALLVEKHWDRWVFEDIKIIPSTPGAPAAEAAPGRLHVPKRNILYYQEIPNVA